MAPRSFRGRIVSSTVVLVGLVMVGVVVGLQLILAWTAQRDSASDLAARARAVVADVQQASGRGGRLVVPDVVDPGARVYDASGDLIGGTIDSRARHTADDLAADVAGDGAGDGGGELRTRGVVGHLRLAAVPFTTSGGQRGVVVVSQDTRLYDRAELYTLVASLLTGLVVVALAGVVARRVTSQALSPVTQMAERAADWSEHDLNHRFDLGPADDELARLGSTLDRLLDRVAIAIRSEQRLTSELAHELRTPLTAIQGSADLALLRGDADQATQADLEEISRAARAMAEVITTLLDVARAPVAAGGATCRAADVVEDLRLAVPGRLSFVDATSGSTARIAAPRDLVVRILSPLVDNAVRHARTTVQLRAHDDRHAVALSVVDDGSGVDEQLRERMFDSGASSAGGTGLGLAIARRVASSLGGTIEAAPVPPGQGAELVVRLPRA